MIIAHDLHRLPADYDIGIIRSRARERGALAAEIARNRQLAEREPSAEWSAAAYEMLHLARPLLDSLTTADAR